MTEFGLMTHPLFVFITFLSMWKVLRFMMINAKHINQFSFFLYFS